MNSEEGGHLKATFNAPNYPTAVWQQTFYIDCTR